MNRNRYWEIMQGNWYVMAQVLFAFIALTMVSSFFLLPGYWYLWLIIISGGLALLVAWHAKNFVYLCPGCGEVFKVSRFDNFISPNSVNKKYLRCPKCGRRTWTDILRTKE